MLSFSRPLFRRTPDVRVELGSVVIDWASELDPRRHDAQLGDGPIGISRKLRAFALEMIGVALRERC
jgi:hypothetical protein